MQRQRLPEKAVLISAGRWLGSLLEQLRPRHDETGDAEAALDRSLVEKRILESMPPLESLDGFDVGPVGSSGRNQTRHHRGPVEVHGAGTALSFGAAFLGSGEAASGGGPAWSRIQSSNVTDAADWR